LGGLQFLADFGQCGSLPRIDLGGDAFDGVGEARTFSPVEFNLVAMGAMPAGKPRSTAESHV
jgi:hypothetical protein